MDPEQLSALRAALDFDLGPESGASMAGACRTRKRRDKPLIATHGAFGVNRLAACRRRDSWIHLSRVHRTNMTSSPAVADSAADGDVNGSTYKAITNRAATLFPLKTELVYKTRSAEAVT
jgi:hypothetical protein